MSPVLFWHVVAYLPKEYYCYVPFMNLRGIIWACFIAYGNPLIFLLSVYLRIAIFLRQQAHNPTLVVNQRQKRDLIVIRRILITIGLLILFAIPAIIFLIMLYITGEQHPLLYRIVWFFLGLSMFGLSISQVIFTRQLKNIVLKNFRSNQIVP